LLLASVGCLVTGSLAAIALASMLAISRPIETPDECIEDAVARWGLIARVIGHVAEEPPSEWRWGGPVGQLQLVRGVVTIMKHESTFSYRVHAGLKRGGHAVCLLQIEPSEAARVDVEPEALVGVNEAATELCVRTGVRMLGRMRSLAEHRCSGSHWFGASVAAYGSGAGCVPTGKWAEGVAARVVTYGKTAFRKPLPPFMAELVREEIVQ
jgi:hypothetical protein